MSAEDIKHLVSSSEDLANQAEILMNAVRHHYHLQAQVKEGCDALELQILRVRHAAKHVAAAEKPSLG